MGELRGFDRVVDQVIRRREFERAHAVEITHVTDPWQWIARWDADGNHITIRRAELSQLLDELDNLLG